MRTERALCEVYALGTYELTRASGVLSAVLKEA